MSKFFENVYLSCSNFKFLGSAIRRTYGAAFGHFIALVTCISLITSTIMGLGFATGFDEITKIFGDDTPDFSLSIADGTLATTLPQPYTFANGFLTIDTTGTVTSLDDKPFGILITDSAITVKQDEEVSQTLPIKDLPPFELTKAQAAAWIDAYARIVKIGFVIAIVVFGWLGAFLSHLTYSLIAALIAMILVKKQLSFNQLHAIALYAVTGPIILNSLSYLFGGPFPFVYTALFLVMYVNAVTAARSS